MRRGASFDANEAWWQLREKRQHLPTLQLTADHHLSNRVKPCTWKTDFAMSRPIVAIVCIGSSSESWEPQPATHF
jgi:hypothetical protein